MLALQIFNELVELSEPLRMLITLTSDLLDTSKATPHLDNRQLVLLLKLGKQKFIVAPNIVQPFLTPLVDLAHLPFKTKVVILQTLIASTQPRQFFLLGAEQFLNCTHSP